MTAERLCACGCGRALPADAGPRRQYFSRACVKRAYVRRKAEREGKPPKPESQPSPLRSAPKRPSPAAVRAAEQRQWQRRESLASSLERRVAEVARGFREGR